MSEDIYRSLTEAAVELNRLSDDLSNEVEKVNLTLRDLNVGVEASLRVDDEKAKPIVPLLLGYLKVDGQWGIVTRRGQADWHHFRRSSREDRIQTIGSLPSLLYTLLLETRKMARAVTEAAQKAKETLEAIVDVKRW